MIFFLLFSKRIWIVLFLFKFTLQALFFFSLAFILTLPFTEAACTQYKHFFFSSKVCFLFKQGVVPFVTTTLNSNLPGGANSSLAYK